MWRSGVVSVLTGETGSYPLQIDLIVDTAPAGRGIPDETLCRELLIPGGRLPNTDLAWHPMLVQRFHNDADHLTNYGRLVRLRFP